MNTIAKAVLNNYKVEDNIYKGEPYRRCVLSFRLTWFWLFKSSREIIYDLTMFDDYKTYQDYWDDAIKSKSTFQIKAIQHRKIF